MSVDDSDSEAAPLRLDHFLKINSISESGGQAKLMIQGGEVNACGEPVTSIQNR